MAKKPYIFCDFQGGGGYGPSVPPPSGFRRGKTHTFLLLEMQHLVKHLLN